MSEQLAQQLLVAVGSGNASVQTAINLIKAFGAPRVQGFLAEIAAGGPRANEVRAGLLVSLLCCSDRLGEQLERHGIRAQRRTIMRAVKQTQELAAALRRMLAGKATEEDLDLARAAIARAGSEPAAAHDGHRDQSPPEVQSDSAAAPGPESTQPPSPAHQRDQPRQGPKATSAPTRGAAGPMPEPSPPAGQQREGIHIYGGKGALAIEPCMSRSGNLALTVDAAQACGVRQYDWRNKIIIQLTEKEMLLLFAVLRGFLSRFEATAHGQANDKSFSIENQQSKFYVKVVQKGRPMVTLPVEPGDAALLVMMLGEAIVQYKPMLADLQGVDRLVKPLTDMMLSVPPRQAA